MMLQMSEEENIIFDKFMSEEDEEKRKMLPHIFPLLLAYQHMHLYYLSKSFDPPVILYSDTLYNLFFSSFPVEESYFCYIIENIYRSGYIEGVIMVPILGEPHPRIKYAENLCITPKGIE